MSTEYIQSITQIRPDSVLYSRTEAVESIALSAIIAMVAGNIEIAVDNPDQYSTKDSIEQLLSSSSSQAEQFVNNALDELKDAVISRLRTGNLKTRITALRFCDVDGLLDDVDVKVDFK